MAQWKQSQFFELRIREIKILKTPVHQHPTFWSFALPITVRLRDTQIKNKSFFGNDL